MRHRSGMTSDESRHNLTVRRLLRDIAVTWAALLLWPVTLTVGLVALVRRARRHERLMGGRDVSWFGRRVGLIVGSVFAYLVVGVILLSVASIFTTIPDI